MGPAMLLGIDWDPDWNFEYDEVGCCIGDPCGLVEA